MTKVNTSIHESRRETRSATLSTGGFVELELADPENGYLKVHLGKPKDHDISGMGNAWRYIHHGSNKENTVLLIELRDACTAILESIS